MPFEIPFVELAWWFFTIFALGGAIGVAISENLFHSALYLVVSLFGVAGYYVLLSAGFLAVVQVMVYIGAIAILILFAIMFAQRLMKPDEETANRQWLPSAVVAAAMFSLLLAVVNGVNWPVSTASPTDDTILQLGLAFLGSYLIPFLVVSVLLSVALIGAIFLAREKTEAEEA
jgi:NADH-quinone oxidoreductase subunit J